MVHQDTLLHGETLLVVSTSDLEDVALEFVSQGSSINLLRETFIIENTASQGEVHQEKSYSLFSSSISIVFWAPVGG